VLYFMASQLKIHVKNFQFAGTKDRRGITAQRIAVFRVRKERIIGLQRLAKGWIADDFKYETRGLALGDLAGNEFLLTLRDCRTDGDETMSHEQRLAQAQEVVAKAADSFHAKGFINYYGLQRFGTFSTGTHVIGLKMLQGNLQGAIDSILAYNPALLETDTGSKIPQDDIDRATAIHKWRQTGRSRDALDGLPKRFQSESSIIQYLGKVDRKTGQQIQANDWQGALMTTQRNLRLMYVHAYQSLVWNTVAGKRWELFGNRVVEGDLVIVGDKDSDGATGGKPDDVDEDGEPIIHPAAGDQAPSAEDIFTRARPLSRAEADSGRYNIFDIVLPLPGFDVQYPANEIGKFYEEFMGSETGGGLDPHKMRRSWKDISLSGGYRKVMARPGPGFEANVRGYEGENEQMIETDVERLRREAKLDENGAESGEVKQNDIHDGEPKRIAVVMKLQLGSSQYATMALRELTKGGARAYRPEFSATR